MGILRLFMAIVVLISHMPDGLVIRLLHPALAVQCFYCISGFYVQLLINQFRKTDGNWTTAFYKSRALRIFPTYYIFLIATLIFTDTLLNHLNNDSPGYFVLFVLSNLVIFSQDILRFIDLGWLTVMGQSWTLAIELMFYCIAPFLLTKKNSIVVLVILASISCRFMLNAYGLNQNGWLYGLFPCEIALFLLGSLAYRFYEKFLHNTHPADTLTLKFIGFIALGSLLYLVYEGWHFINGGSWGGSESLGVLYSYWIVLVTTIFCLPFIFKLSKHSKLDRFIGELSYPLYIGHFFVLDMVREQIAPKYQDISVLLITTILAVFIVRFIETPIARYRESFKKVKTSSEDSGLIPESAPALSR